MLSTGRSFRLLSPSSKSAYRTSARLSSSAGEQWSKWEYGSFGGGEDKVARASRGLRARKQQSLDPLWTHISDAEIRRATAALLPFASAERQTRFEQVLGTRTDRFRFVFENPSNPNNVWAALRTFDAFGLQCVDIILDRDTDTYTDSHTDTHSDTHTDTDSEHDSNIDISCAEERNSREAAAATQGEREGEAPRGRMTSALGSQKWLTLRGHDSTAACVAQLRSEGYVVLATDLHEGSLRLPAIDWDSLRPKNSDTHTQQETSAAPPKVAIVMGNELRGISQEMRRLADFSFYIPMRGFAESLNLSVACAVICSTLESRGLLGGGIADDVLRERILFSWLLRSVKGSLGVLRRHGIEGIGKDDRSVFNSIGSISTKP